MLELVGDQCHAEDKVISGLVGSAVAKNTRRLVPLLGLACFFNNLDRTSVGIAALQMNDDIGLRAEQFGWAPGASSLVTACWKCPAI